MTLILENICHSYGDDAVLKGIGLTVESGEIVSLLGPSGCGKTTLLRVIAGLEAVQAGHITLNGQILASAGLNPPPEKRPIGLVFQEHALFPGMNVAANISFGISNLPTDERNQKTRQLLEMVNLSDFDDRKPGTLSGGQQQRVALARALAPEPEIMLLDEPFASVDVMRRRPLREAARLMLKKAGSTAILVTHDPEEALEMSDKIAVMHKGQIVQFGTPQDIVEKPSSAAVAQLFGEADCIDGHLRDGYVETQNGAFQLPAGFTNPGDLEALELVVRPSGVKFEESGDADWQVRDVRYNTSGSILYVSAGLGANFQLIRVQVDHDTKIAPGYKGRLILDGKNFFLFPK